MPARGLTAGYELRLGGMVLHARVEDGVLIAVHVLMTGFGPRG
ncbi:hypothetical protein [Planomonospora parontospora]|nr:hypothetical protein [Planomonospora parontospora]